MKKLQGIGLVCLTLATINMIPAYALHRACSYNFSLGAGHEYFASKRHMDNTDLTYIAAGYDFTDEWGFEAFYGFFNTDFKTGWEADRNISGSLFMVDGVYHFTPFRNLQPYALAGVGITGLSPNRNDANNEGNINAALGLQWFADSIVAFRLEARDIYTIIGGKNDLLLSAGVSFVFDIC